MGFGQDSPFGRRPFLTNAAVAGGGTALGGLLPSRGSVFDGGDRIFRWY